MNHKKKEFTVSPLPCSTMPLIYDDSLCIGCNRCADVCQCDILLPSSEKGKHPIIMYPGECYYCGACVMACPRPGAVKLQHPLMNRAKFVPVKKSSESKIKNIVFDVGKVLVSYEPKQNLERLGYDEHTQEAIMNAMFANPLWNESDRGVLTDEELIAKFVENAPEYETQIREAYKKIGNSIEILPHSVEWVKDLKAQGYHLYIISNYGDYTYQQTSHKMKFLPYMDGAIFSYQYKIIKPDRRIYETLLETYQLKAEECVFIDDSMQNVIAAREAGFYAIQFQNYEQAREELSELCNKKI